jgi:hypothetical protein
LDVAVGGVLEGIGVSDCLCKDILKDVGSLNGLQTAQQLTDRCKHRSHRWEGSGDKLTKRIAILGAIVKDVLMVKAEGVVVVVLMELTD